MSAYESETKRARMDAPTSSWVPTHTHTDFTIHNIPFGVVSAPTHAAAAASAPAAGGAAAGRTFIATAIGDHVLDLGTLARRGFFPDWYAESLQQTTLNDFMAKGRRAWSDARLRIQCLLASPDQPGAVPDLRTDAKLQSEVLLRAADVVPQLPANIGDYTDFYSSREHATNVGIMFRGAANALQPNWLHLPVGYHGRSSSVVVSGTNFRRPCGQLQKEEDASKGSAYGPSKQLDFELEVGAFVGPGNDLGEPISIREAEDHIFGLTLLNDWSARDIQKWEYVPLGPFGAKNFCTTISPWIITMDALEPFRCPTSAGEQLDPIPLPYLRDPKYGSYDVNLEVTLRPKDAAEEHVISRSNYRYMYWNVRQQLVHHTVTGCNMRPGDLLGSGTISGTEPGSFGSMLELAWKGTRPVQVSEGVTRVFLQDYDEVNIRGWCERDGKRIGFGDCKGMILPAKPFTE